jgi:hypothetical protein
MDDSNKLLFQFRAGGPQGAPLPDLTEVARRFGFAAGELDPDYGVVMTDSVDRLCVALASAAARERIESRLDRQADPATGFFANPRVEPTGDTGGGMTFGL